MLSMARAIVTGTVATCFRYRVTGLAAEAGFFALLSLPPLLLGLVGALGFVVRPYFGNDVVDQVQTSIIDTVHTVLANDSVDKQISQTLADVLHGGRPDIVSIGFVLAIWSGSRALNVYIDTVTIMYGLAGRRGIIKTRALSVTMYVLALLIGSVALPLVVAGPTLVSEALPPRWSGWVQAAYWPTVLILCVLFLATLYHFAVPVRARWRRDLPGAVLAVGGWLLLSWVVRTVIGASVGGTSIYGPLSAPILVLVWLYFLAISVLIGAAFNSTLDAELTSREGDRRRDARLGLHEGRGDDRREVVDEERRRGHERERRGAQEHPENPLTPVRPER